MKLNKKEFVEKVRNLAHSEPTRELWERMYYVYTLYQNKTIESTLRGYYMLKEQKEEFEKREEMRKMLQERIKEYSVQEKQDDQKQEEKRIEEMGKKRDLMIKGLKKAAAADPVLSAQNVANIVGGKPRKFEHNSLKSRFDLSRRVKPQHLTRLIYGFNPVGSYLIFIISNFGKYFNQVARFHFVSFCRRFSLLRQTALTFYANDILIVFNIFNGFKIQILRFYFRRKAIYSS